MLEKKKVLLAKAEASYGVDPSLAATNAILTQNLKINPYQGNRVSRNYDSPNLGNNEEINTGPYSEITFDVELAGSGTAGTAPGWGVLVRGCAYSETVDAGVSVRYDPASANHESLALDFNIDGQRHILLGARGDITSISMGRGNLPLLSFRFIGLYATPTQAVAAADFSLFQSPLPVTNANTPTYQLHGFDVDAEEFSFALNNEVVYRNVIGSERIIITDRAPSGKFKIEAPVLSDKNYFTTIESHAGIVTGALSIVHGKTAGNIIEVAAPKVQLSSLAMENSDNVLVYTMDARFMNNAGDDDFSIIVR